MASTSTVSPPPPPPPHAAPSSSRIFVRDLPPNLREEDFKKHFAQLAQPTDIKLIAKRRIGYVGYKSPEEAAKAVKYYNRSFIRMSKIGVEISKAFGEVQSRRKRRDNETRDRDPILEERKPQSKKENGEQDASQARNAKLDEFLDVMAPSAKSRTWANEDSTNVRRSTPPAPPVLDDSDTGSEDEYQTVSRKRKRSTEVEDESYASRIKSPRVLPIKRSTIEKPHVEVVQPTKDSHETNENDDVSEKGDVEIITEAAPLVSDSDWLRSRTSRLLGLVDDDEFDEGQQKQPEIQETSKIQRLDRNGNREASRGPQVTDAERQTSEEIEANPTQAIKHNRPEELAPADRIPAVAEAEKTGRLFIRNLSYTAIESDLRDHFSNYGEIEEVHISRDTRSGASKGFGYIQFEMAKSAPQAMEALDGKPFQGRLLHILPAAARREHGLNEYEIAKLPLKKQQQIRRKAEASKAIFKWNSLYMNPDAIISSVADRLGVAKADVLDPTSSDAAIKQAHSETNILQETKHYFTSHGVDLESFKKKDFSETAILVKNFPFGTAAEDLKKLFEVFGTVTKILMPPSATIAVVEMEQGTQARSALRSLAYRKFRDSLLFLEKAPKKVFDGQVSSTVKPQTKEGKASTSELLQSTDDTGPVLTSTLFVRNLNFSTSSDDLQDLFKPLNGFLSARVKTKTDPKRPGESLSMGFGFVEMRSQQDSKSALSALNGYRLAGHELIIQQSTRALDAADERRREDLGKKLAGQRTKIIIKNLPFETSKKDVRALIQPYGKLRSVRVPKKFDSSTRGFAFANFVTTREAENAMKALHGVHLLGRRLNLDFAAADLIDPEEEIEKMQKKVGNQADKVAIQKLTAGGRKKFSVNQGDDADVD